MCRNAHAPALVNMTYYYVWVCGVLSVPVSVQVPVPVA